MVLTLFAMDLSPPVRAVKLVLAALGLEYKHIELDIIAKENHQEWFLKLNPQHSIPTLQDGDFAVWDSHAIAGYLIHKYGKDDSLYPRDPEQRAIVDQRLHFDSGVLFVRLLRLLDNIIHGHTDTKEPDQESLDKMEEDRDFLEKFLLKDYLAGDSVTIADLCCIATVTSLNMIKPMDESRYPKLAAWIKRMTQLPYYETGNGEPIKAFQKLIGQ